MILPTNAISGKDCCVTTLRTAAKETSTTTISIITFRASFYKAKKSYYYYHYLNGQFSVETISTCNNGTSKPFPIVYLS